MAYQNAYPPYARVDSYIDASPKPSFDGSPDAQGSTAAAAGSGEYFGDSEAFGAGSRRFQQRQQAGLPVAPYSDAAWTSNQTGKAYLLAGKKKWILGGIIAGIVLLAAIGAGVGTAVSKRKNGSSSSGLSSTGGKSTSGNSSDPSVFELDSRLKKSFWGIAYESESVQVPACGATQANVTRDIQLLSQLTTRIRMYGSNCNQTALVLQAIQDTKVDLDVYLAVYIDSNTTANDAQWTAIQDALKTYGTDHILGIAIGNEYILNSADQTTGTTNLLAMIQTYNESLTAMDLDKTISMGTSDAGSVMSLALAEGIDFYHANVHPWFGSVSIEDAAGWTYSFFQEFDIAIANQTVTRSPPKVMIGETGWPTASLNSSTSTDGPSIASVANLQKFLDTFVCQANANGTAMETFMFEFRDANWKAPEFGNVEPFWGIFDDSTVLKDLTIPDCPIQ